MKLRILCYLVLGISPILAALPGQPPEGVPTQDQAALLGMSGGKQRLWLYQRSWHPDQERRLLTFGLRPAGSKVFVAPAMLSGLVGTVLATAIADDELHVFYDDGSHRRYRFGRQGLRGFTELPVPAAGRLRAVAGDPDAAVLYAIVPVESARAVQAQRLAEVEAQAAHERLKASGDGSSESPASGERPPDPAGAVLEGTERPAASAGEARPADRAGDAVEGDGPPEARARSGRSGEPEIAAGDEPPADRAPATGQGPLTAASASESASLAAALGPDLTGVEFAMLRYQGGSWHVHAAVGPPFGAAGPCFLAVGPQGRLHLLYLDPSDGTYQWTYLEDSRRSVAQWLPGRCLAAVSTVILKDPRWSVPQPLPGGGDLAVLSFHTQHDQLVIVAGSDESGAASIRALLGDESTWQWGEPFDLQGLDPAALVAAPFGNNVALATIGKDSYIRCGLWKASGGAPVESPAEVVALHHEGRQLLPVHIQNIIAIAVLGILLGYVFLRRQESITRELDLPAQYIVAGLGRRLIGFILDLGPVAMLTLPAWGPPLQEWWAYREFGVLNGQAPPLSDAVLGGWLIGCAVYIIYCTICEAAFATTPGKLAVQCRVVNENGHRCTLGQIVLRNLLRGIELFPLYQFWPTIILLFFTRNRQRLGDLIGRTLVVQRIHPQRTRTALSSPPASDREA